MAEDAAIEQIIPIFTDKVIYFGGTDGVSETSYSVSSSYRGILRLSPNDATSIKTDGSSLNYADSITKYIVNEPIQVSDSDGNLIDMKYTKGAVTISKVYGIGMVSPKSIIVYAKTINDFTISGVKFPTMTNKVQSYDDDETNPTGLTNMPYGPSWESENSEAILKNTDILCYLKSRWTYKNAKTLIEDAVREALLDLETVPSGSVHFFPVTYSQYKALLSKNTPNKKGSDPLIRDYLLCDGRRYLTRDFPELAKILDGATVSYERPYAMQNDLGGIQSSSFTNDTGTTVRYQTGGPGKTSTPIQPKSAFVDTVRLRRFKHVNGENDISYYGTRTKYEELHTFRVPDLRHLFPKSCIISDINNNDKKATKSVGPYNKTGIYHVDSLPSSISGSDFKDDHFHFSFFGSYNIRYRYPYPVVNNGKYLPQSYLPGKCSAETSYFRKAANSNVLGHAFSKGGGASFAILSNNTWWLSQSYFQSRMDAHNNSTIPAIFAPAPPRNCFWRHGRYAHVSGPVNKSYYVITSPGKIREYDGDDLVTNRTPDVGLTSEDISRFAEDSIIGGKQSGAELEKSIVDNSNKSIATVYNPVSYAQESTPRYVGYLPLIKI